MQTAEKKEHCPFKLVRCTNTCKAFDDLTGKCLILHQIDGIYFKAVLG